MNVLTSLDDKLRNLRRQEIEATSELEDELHRIKNAFRARRLDAIEKFLDGLTDDELDVLDKDCLPTFRVDVIVRNHHSGSLKLTLIKLYREEFKLTYGFAPPLVWTKRRVCAYVDAGKHLS